MTAKVFIPTDQGWKTALRNLYSRGEIDLEQYAGCLRRITKDV